MCEAELVTDPLSMLDSGKDAVFLEGTKNLYKIWPNFSVQRYHLKA